jgi:hypothetical protein
MNETNVQNVQLSKPSLERAAKAARVNLTHWTRCSEHNNIVATEFYESSCASCQAASQAGKPVGGYQECWFVIQPGETVGVYSEQRGRLRDLLISYRAAKEVRRESLASFAGTRGFKLKTVNRG